MTLLDTNSIRIALDVVPDPAAVYRHLVETVAWDTRIVSRKVASFGKPYNYSGTVWPEVPLPESILEIIGHVTPHLSFLPDNCLANWYPQGTSKMGFHSDNVEDLAPDTGIAVVSLGAERPLVFRSINDKSQQETYLLPAGSLLVMSAEMQTDWKHALPPQPESQGRISLTFRKIDTTGEPPSA